MDLIAKILQFDDDQKVACGLKVGTRISTCCRYNIQKYSEYCSVKPTSKVEGDNLAELWVTFYLKKQRMKTFLNPPTTPLLFMPLSSASMPPLKMLSIESNGV